MDLIKTSKCEFICKHIETLWKFDFIHKWRPPSCVRDCEFESEKSIFRKSLDLKTRDFEETLPLIQEDIDSMGELASHFEPARQKIADRLKKREERWGRILNGGVPKSVKPYKREKKIGRNEPCPCGSGKKYKKCCGK